ncbi:hypothetical protein Cni_G14636 [Canna indica]|uniref:Uncharacterized protein n=1 Tax=Canna indica TaxID=4628 RepID=A0AAQ3KCD5_9LILI|nr:hypothetical protein Cni_G14636 [Canna indica]
MGHFQLQLVDVSLSPSRSSLESFNQTDGEREGCEGGSCLFPGARSGGGLAVLDHALVAAVAGLGGVGGRHLLLGAEGEEPDRRQRAGHVVGESRGYEGGGVVGAGGAGVGVGIGVRVGLHELDLHARGQGQRRGRGRQVLGRRGEGLGLVSIQGAREEILKDHGPEGARGCRGPTLVSLFLVVVVVVMMVEAAEADILPHLLHGSPLGVRGESRGGAGRR